VRQRVVVILKPLGRSLLPNPWFDGRDASWDTTASLPFPPSNDKQHYHKKVPDRPLFSHSKIERPSPTWRWPFKGYERKLLLNDSCSVCDVDQLDQLTQSLAGALLWAQEPPRRLERPIYRQDSKTKDRVDMQTVIGLTPQPRRH
jgi:hypothetical protein